MKSIEKVEVISSLISSNNIDEAKDYVSTQYPHQYLDYETRKMTVYDKLKIYIHDGFIDRYTGNKLLFPNVLRIFSHELGDAFPYHPNWKMSECHIAYWELMPTYDHVFPIARGGKDVDENIVTTSMLMNSIKSNFLLEETGFTVHERGSMKEWDGMIAWYKDYIDSSDNGLLNDTNVNQWHKALLRYEKEFGKLYDSL